MERSPLVGRVRESNRQARDAWRRWAPHRARVMNVLDSVPAAGPRLALLGAGHLHDVDLEALAERFEQIALIDIDADTVTAAVARHSRASAACTVHAPVDLTGALDWFRQDVPADDVIALIAGHQCFAEATPFDIVVSLGVLTQLMQAVSDADFADADVPRVSLALRDKHLRDLVGLTRAGGTCVLVTDFVSTTSAPELSTLTDVELEPHLARLIDDGNFFTGTNPYRLMALLEETEPFRQRVARATFIGPWLWPITPDRQHLAGAIVAEARTM